MAITADYVFTVTELAITANITGAQPPPEISLVAFVTSEQGSVGFEILWAFYFVEESKGHLFDTESNWQSQLNLFINSIP